MKTYLNTVLSKHWSHHRSATSYCIDEDLPQHKLHLQGGILQILHGKHIGRITNFEEDVFGRWVLQSLQLKNKKKISFISAYRPCNMAIDPTSNTIVKQQYRSLEKKKINCHPRTRFDYDLRLLLLDQRLQGNEIVLGIDANLHRPFDADFENILNDCDLIDIIKHRHGEPTATYRGNTRPDLIAITPYLLDFVAATGHLGDDLSVSSDHSGLFLDFHQDIFSASSNPTAPSERGFTSRNKAKFKKFGANVDRSLSNNLLLQSLFQLLDTATLEEKQMLCDSIDQIITETMIREENRLATQPDIIVWSPIYTDQRKLYLQKKKAIKKFRKEHLFPLKKTDQSIYQDLQQQLKTAKYTLRKIEKKAVHHRLEFLLSKIKTAADIHDQKLLKALRAIYRSEKRRFAFRKLTPIVKGTTPSTLDKIITTDSDTGESITVTTEQEMNTALLCRNIKHFNQASETPLTKKTLSDIIPPFQPSPVIANRILDGDISDFQEQSVIIQELLTSLKNYHLLLKSQLISLMKNLYWACATYLKVKHPLHQEDTIVYIKLF